MDKGRNSKTPDSVKPGERTRRHSVAGELIQANGDEKSLPHYMRSSSGSCHEFCKYGKKHGSEDEVKHPFLRKGKSLVPSEKQSHAGNLNPEEKTKRLAMKLRSLSEIKTNFSDSPKGIKQKASPLKESGLSVKPVGRKIETRLVTEKTETKELAKLPSSSKNEVTNLERANSDIRRKKEAHKPEAATTVTEVKHSSTGSGNEHEKSNTIKKISNSPLQNATTLGKTSNKSRILPVKSQSFSGRSLTVSMDNDLLAKQAISSKSNKTELARSGSSLSHSRCNNEDKTSKSKQNSKLTEKKHLKPSASSLSRKAANEEVLRLKSVKGKKPDVKNQEVEKQHENGNNDNILSVVEKETEKVDWEPEHNLIPVEDADSSNIIEKMPLSASCDENSTEAKILNLENPDVLHLERSFLATDKVNQDSLEPEPSSHHAEDNVQLNSHEEEFLAMDGDLDDLRKNVPEPEKVDRESASIENDEHTDSLDKELHHIENAHSNLQVREFQPTENTEMDYIEAMSLTIENGNVDHLNNGVTGNESEDVDPTEERHHEDQSDHSISPEDDLSVHSFTPDADLSKVHSVPDNETPEEKPVEKHLASPADDDQLSHLALPDDDQPLHSVSPNEEQPMVHLISDNEENTKEKPDENMSLHLVSSVYDESVDFVSHGDDQLHLATSNAEQLTVDLVSDNEATKEKPDENMSLHLISAGYDESLDLVSQDDVESLHSNSPIHDQSMHSQDDVKSLYSNSPVHDQSMCSPLDKEAETEELEDEYGELSELDSEDIANESENDEYLEEEEMTRRVANDSTFTESNKRESEHDCSESESKGESSKPPERRPRKTTIVNPEESDPAPCKVKFSRGKIIELQTETTGPKRLRFRRGRGPNDDANGGQVGRKSYTRSHGETPVEDDTNSDAPRVQLRHQDVQDKKDAQGLFNNVIEETASKLVEARKSKVKALVGAFETVISLQDTKPASTI